MKINIDLLPIGTICKLKGKPFEVMIVGFMCVNEKGKPSLYAGVPYPFGMLDFNRQIDFDPKDIERIVFMGYVSEIHNGLSIGINRALNGEKIDGLPSMKERINNE